MSEMQQKVGSVCPDCLARIDARLVRRGDQVLLVKECPDHGFFSTVIWQGEPSFDSWVRPKVPYTGGQRRGADRGCPFDCGLCSYHTQRTCTALVEVTSRCNLNCPVCFADSGGGADDPAPEELKSIFARLMSVTGGCNLQLSGGEPTVRSDLERIVALARQEGFSFIQLNSNGLRLADDPELAPRLKDAGLSSVFLQFDGVRDEVYSTLRGRALFERKCRAIDNLAAADIGVVLVPTVVPNLNTDQLWQIVRFGLDRQPQVRGVHFQPISYFGRFPADFVPRHVTLPEIMQALAEQSDRALQVADFHPPGCEHALCSFSAKYLLEEDGLLRRLSPGSCCDCTPLLAEEAALNSISATARQWGTVLPIYAGDDRDREAEDELSRFLHRARTHTFSISAMAFQDCWNLNLERLSGCCIHVAQADGRLIPFCSFNLTSRSGRSLHRPQLHRTTSSRGERK